MKGRNTVLWIVVAVLAATGFIPYLYLHRRAALTQSGPGAKATASGRVGSGTAGTNGGMGTAAGGTTSNKVFRIRRDQVLATVNGTTLTLRDLIPLGGTNAAGEEQVDQATYDYFLGRAIDRELILQTARAQGVGLTESQDQQLAKLRALREQPEPGLVSKLTVDAAQIDFELRDSQAFMLQTALMAKGGATPNVTPDQVEQYYLNHLGEFGDLPADPQERQAAWQRMDVQIRNRLAASARSQYQAQLTQYMNQLKSKAAIHVSALQ
jgi:hypothetical protein